jgi:hypothetical protein
MVLESSVVADVSGGDAVIFWKCQIIYFRADTEERKNNDYECNFY